jgi:hypothetical protein
MDTWAASPHGPTQLGHEQALPASILGQQLLRYLTGIYHAELTKVNHRFRANASQTDTKVTVLNGKHGSNESSSKDFGELYFFNSASQLATRVNGVELSVVELTRRKRPSRVTS